MCHILLYRGQCCPLPSLEVQPVRVARRGDARGHRRRQRLQPAQQPLVLARRLHAAGMRHLAEVHLPYPISRAGDCLSNSMLESSITLTDRVLG